MSEMELVELLGVILPTLRAAIKAIYKSGTLCPVSTQRCDLATPKSWATFYNLEVVIALAFRLNTYEASKIRHKVLESLYQRKENGISLLLFSSIGLKQQTHNKKQQNQQIGSIFFAYRKTFIGKLLYICKLNQHNKFISYESKSI